MRVLFVSNLFPPYHVGGYELRCAQVAGALAARGEDVRVVTSDARLNRGTVDYESPPFPVDRRLGHYRLHTPPGWPYTLVMARRQLEDVRRFSAILDEFDPDVVMWWNMAGLTKAILPLPAARNVPDVGFVEDCWMVTEFGRSGETEKFHWFDFWRGDWGPRPLRPIIRYGVERWERRLDIGSAPTRPFNLDPSRVCFVSEYLKSEHEAAGLDLSSTQVIHGGVPVGRFRHYRQAAEFERDPLNVLFVGFLSRDRGLHTLIEALGRLSVESRERIRLSIAYGGPVRETDYTRELKSRLEELDLTEQVRFMPRVPHEKMPDLYRTHQVLVFPSTRGEGFPLAMTEAAAAGAAVITTGSGGAMELAERAEMPVFPKNDPVALAHLLERLLNDRRRLAELADRGQRVVLEQFTVDRMVDEIHDVLTLESSGTGQSA